jgi:hypothetical protein
MGALSISGFGTRDRETERAIDILLLKLKIEGCIPIFPVGKFLKLMVCEALESFLFISHRGDLQAVKNSGKFSRVKKVFEITKRCLKLSSGTGKISML